jgi:hypothetical protein
MLKQNYLRLIQLAKKSYVLGTIGEHFAMLQLNVYGQLKTTHIATNREKLGDIRLAGTDITIEIKTARLAKDGRWTFTIYKKGSQSCHNADYVLLQCFNDEGLAQLYLIPREAVGTAHTIKITRSYMGKYAVYKTSYAAAANYLKNMHLTDERKTA